MKAALLTKTKSPLELTELDLTDLRFGQVSVLIRASGICGAQMQEIDGHKGTHFPRLMGHEGSGVVFGCGAGVKGVSVGDKVVMHWRKGDGIESESPRYAMGGKIITGGQVTTFSEQAIVSESRVTKVAHDTPDELCALLGCSLSTALGTIETEARMQFGESILIVGCGGLGVNLILAAKLRQASRIVVVDNNDWKRSLALTMGAHDFTTIIGWPDEKFDVVVDTTGNPGAISQAAQLLAGGGRFVMVGQPKPGQTVELQNANHFFDGTGKTLMATQGGRFMPSQMIPRYVAMWRSGALNLDGVISHQFPLTEINRAIEIVRDGQAGRILIRP